MDWDCLTVATFFLMVFLGVTVFSPLPLGTVGSGGMVGGDGSGGGAVVG